MEILFSKILKLNEIDNGFISSIRLLEPLSKDFFEKIIESVLVACDLEDQIKLILSRDEILFIETQSQEIKVTLDRIKNGEKLKCVKFYEGMLEVLKNKDVNLLELYLPDFFETNWDNLFSVYFEEKDIRDYYYRKLEIGLIVSSDSLPKELTQYFTELKETYFYSLEKACLSLCRTLLEIALKDRLNKNEQYQNAVKIQAQARNMKKKEFDFRLNECINIAFSLSLISSDLKKKADKIRNGGNDAVHGNLGAKEKPEKNTLSYVRDIIEIIEYLYSQNR